MGLDVGDGECLVPVECHHHVSIVDSLVYWSYHSLNTTTTTTTTVACWLLLCITPVLGVVIWCFLLTR